MIVILGMNHVPSEKAIFATPLDDNLLVNLLSNYP